MGDEDEGQLLDAADEKKTRKRDEETRKEKVTVRSDLEKYLEEERRRMTGK